MCGVASRHLPRVGAAHMCVRLRCWQSRGSQARWKRPEVHPRSRRKAEKLEQNVCRVTVVFHYLIKKCYKKNHKWTFHVWHSLVPCILFRLIMGSAFLTFVFFLFLFFLLNLGLKSSFLPRRGINRFREPNARANCYKKVERAGMCTTCPVNLISMIKRYVCHK